MNIKENDVFRLLPHDASEISNWCRDNYFVAEKRGDGFILVDTYWGVGAGNSSNKTYTPEKLEGMGTVIPLFNLDDVVPVSEHDFMEYADDDRFLIPEQSGYRTRFYVKSTAGKSLQVRLCNAERRLVEKRNDVDSAVRSLEWAVQEVERIKAEIKKSPRLDRGGGE